MRFISGVSCSLMETQDFFNIHFLEWLKAMGDYRSNLKVPQLAQPYLAKTVVTEVFNQMRRRVGRKK